MVWPKGRSFSIEHRVAIGKALRLSPKAIAHRVRLHSDRGMYAKHSEFMKTSPAAIANRAMISVDPEIRAKKSISAKTSPKVAANLTRLRRARPTGIECILREFLLPTLLPGYEMLDEYPWYTYLVDVYVPKLRLVVEADGDYWHGRDEIRQHDRIRDRCLTGHYGLTVVRFGERELNDYAAGRDPGSEFWQKVDQLEGVKVLEDPADNKGRR